MKLSRRFCAMLLAVLMLIPVSVISGISASAIAGAGAPSATNPEMVLGIDLSYYQVGTTALDYARVDFAKLKASGCEFAILRLGYETSVSSGIKIDPSFDQLYKNARAAGMPVGLYLYSYSLTYDAAKADALEVINYIEARNMYFEYPIYFDMETTAQTGTGTTSSQKESICLGWCEALEAAGYFPGIYGPYWVYDVLSSGFKAKYDYWVPAYKSTNPWSSQYTHTSTQSSLGGKPYANGYCMWQYSCCNTNGSSYIFDGVYTSSSQTTINTNLDLNVCYKDYPSIMAQYGYNNCGPSVDKSSLKALIAGAENASHKNYNATNLENLRIAYDAAVAVNNNTSATQDEVDTAAANLLNALKNTSAKTILSTGKSYTSNCTTEGSYGDDGSKLTNGTKGTVDGGSAAYTNLGETAEIIIDLGSVQKVDTFSAYFAAGMWNIYAPADTILEAYVSLDGNSYTQAATSSAEIVTNGNNTYDKANWTTYTITATADQQYDARYVKLVIDNNDTGEYRYVWIDEVEVSCYSGERITDGIYISGMNTGVTAGSTVLFTPAYNSGVVSASVDGANISWTQNVVAKKNSDGSYTIKSNENGNGDTTKSYTLASDEILIASHNWEGSGIDDPVGDSAANFNKLASLAVGTTLYLSGINVQYSFNNISAYVSTGETKTPDSSGGIEENVPQLDGGKNFWLTHYNNNTIEGAGVIFTEAYTGAAWWLHIAFAPTDVADVYKITAISDGTDAGDGVAQDIPEGGFVYCLNKGNNYKEINGDDTATDYTSPNCNNALADALKWKVGDELKISGLNLTAKTIPTSTADTAWYDDAYVCTANYVKYNASAPEYDTTVYDNMLWLTHFNDLTVEGAGVIVTNSDLTNSGWNNYYAFAPVGDGTFELVEYSIGIGTGTSVMPSIPAGGFVYSINVGNDYPAIYEADPVTNAWCKDLPDYTSDNCNAMVEAVGQWEVGKTYRFGNLDLEGETIPTTTAGTNWYEAGYVCAATFEPVTTEEDTSGDTSDDTSDDTSSDNSDDTSDDTSSDNSDDTSDDDWLYGDVDNDGDIDQFDYLLVKRSYFKTYDLTEDEAKRADVDRSVTVDQYDYMYIKRHYFGTYEIVQKTK